MAKVRSATAPRPHARPVFWAFLILSVLLKTSLSSAAEADTHPSAAGEQVAETIR